MLQNKAPISAQQLTDTVDNIFNILPTETMSGRGKFQNLKR